jgi:hypothetical protein
LYYRTMIYIDIANRARDKWYDIGNINVGRADRVRPRIPRGEPN